MTWRDLAERFTAGERVRVGREPPAYARVATSPDLCDEGRGLDLVAMLALGATALQDDAHAGRLAGEGVDEPARAARAPNEWLPLLVVHGCDRIVIRERERAVKVAKESRSGANSPFHGGFTAGPQTGSGVAALTPLGRKVWFERGVWELT